MNIIIIDRVNIEDYTTQQMDLEKLIKIMRDNVILKKQTEHFRELRLNRISIINELKKQIDLGIDVEKNNLEIKTNESEIRNAKTNLSAVIAGAIFKTNKSIEKENIDYLTGLISIDFDHVDNMADIIGKLTKDKHTLCLYTSPSGEGLKLITQYTKLEKSKIEEQIAFFETQVYPHLEKYYLDTYGLITDPQCKNVNRNAFMCHDPLSLYYPGAEVFKIKPNKIELNKVVRNSPILKLQNNTGILDKIHQALISNQITLSGFTSSVFPNTAAYQYWIDFGWFLCDFYPNKPDYTKQYFHMFSSLDSSYKQSLCETKINELIKSFDPNKKNYKLYFHQVVIWAQRNIGLELSAEEKKELKQQPNFIIDYVKENMIVKREEITDKKYITFTHIDKTMSVEYVDTLIQDETLNTLVIILGLYFTTLHSVQSTLPYLYNDNMITFNKIDDYFKKIRTDDETNLKQFIDFVPVNEPFRVKDMYLRSWMLGVLCNFYKNEDKCNKFLIFKGKQGWGKTTLVKNIMLLPFMDLDIVDEGFRFSSESKDDMMKLCESLFLFDDELSASSKRDIENIKKITSQSSITYRRPYGIVPRTYSRISSFLGCSNKDEVFKDETGGNRWWVLELNAILYPHTYKGIYTKDFMEKVWGYIYDEFIKGERWNEGKYKIDYSLQMEMAEKSRFISDEEEILFTILKPDPNNLMTAMDIKEELAKNYRDLNLGNKYNTSLHTLLNSIGIKRKETKSHNKPVRYYCRFKRDTTEQDVVKNGNIDLDEMIRKAELNKDFSDIDQLIEEKIKKGGTNHPSGDRKGNA